MPKRNNIIKIPFKMMKDKNTDTTAACAYNKQNVIAC